MELVFSDKPFYTAAQILSAQYKGGKTGVAGGSEGLFKALSENGLPFTVFEKNLFEAPEHIRFFIGQGGFFELNAAKRLAKDNKVILIPDTAYRLCFNGLCNYGYRFYRFKEPDYVIIDTKNFAGSNSELYSSLCLALADTVDILSGRGIGNQALHNIRGRLLEAVLCPGDWRSSLTLLKESEECIAAGVFKGAGEKLPSINRMEGGGVFGAILDYFTFYLINMTLLQFTKFDFNGILLGADRAGIREGALRLKKPRVLPPRYPYLWLPNLKKAALTREELRAAALNFRKVFSAATDRSLIEKALYNLTLAWELEDSDGMFAALLSEGFIEGLKGKWN